MRGRKLPRQEGRRGSTLGAGAPVVYLALGLVKGWLAFEGATVVPKLLDLAAMRHVSVPQAKRVLYAYVLLQIPDSVKAMIQGERIGSFVHHFATGVGVLIDVGYGSERVRAMATLSMLTEVIGPVYQYMNWLSHTGRGDSPAAQRANYLGVALTLGVRIPQMLFTAVMCVRDVYFRWIAGRVADGGDPEVYNQIQPCICILALFGALVLLRLDYTWTRGMLRKIDQIHVKRRS